MNVQYENDTTLDEEVISVALIPGKSATRVPDEGEATKFAAIFGIGFLTLGYSTMEIFYAMKVGSLALLSDGFHNLSDVIALIIAFWAIKQSAVTRTDSMTYGWKRAEILGAVMNGCFLVSLCVYILLESIPRFIAPPPEEGNSWIFISVSGAGLFVNLVGTLVFAVSGHGHSHAGGGGHSHGGHGHSHEGHGHSHEGHGHSHEKKEKKKGSHGHSHGDKEEHEHSHDKEDHGHGHDKKKKDHHGHSRDAESIDPVNSDKSEKKEKVDLNMQAVFLHYLGDALSSCCVLIAGLLMHFFPTATWVVYLDPISSLVIVVLIMLSVIPLIKNCAVILLQQAPAEVDTVKLRRKIEKIQGIEGVHDMHVWQLVDSMVIASLHIHMEDCDSHTFKNIVARCKSVLHSFGIHSSTLQPEFITPTSVSILLNYFTQPTTTQQIGLPILTPIVLRIGAAKTIIKRTQSKHMAHYNNTMLLSDALLLIRTNQNCGASAKRINTTKYRIRT